MVIGDHSLWLWNSEVLWNCSRRYVGQLLLNILNIVTNLTEVRMCFQAIVIYMPSHKCFVMIFFFPIQRPGDVLISFPGPGGWGDSAYERGGDARRKFWMKPLKETDLGVAQAFFDP